MSLSFKLSACALTVTLAMAPVMSQAWEKDKTYQLPSYILMIITVTFGTMIMASTV